MKARNLFLLFAISFIALFFSCAKDDFVEVAGVCPIVESTSPEDGEINVALDKTITATFNESMNPATINSSTFTVTESTPAKSTAATTISGTVSYSGATASFNPASSLTDNTTYTCTIKTLVKDMAGNALQEDYVWIFSTGAFIPPTVISTFPDDGDIDVDPVDLEITATFSQKMTKSTIEAALTFTVKQGTIDIPGTVSYVDSDSTATFIPTSDLELGKIYTATISTAAENLNNIAMVSDKVWSFTTIAPNPPTITHTDPYDLETGVALNKVISATFSEEMDPLTITDLTFTLSDGTSLITGLVEYSGFVATFTPEIELLPNTTYEATITTGAMNLDGIALENDSVWTFTTNEQFTLTIIAANGTVTVDPELLAYDNGTIVTLTAIADPLYVFTSWSGDATGISLTKQILMNSNKTVTANFELVAVVCTPPVDLGLSGDYIILAQSGISNTGTTAISGDMGIFPAAATAITGFDLILPAGGAFSTSSLVNGNIYAPGYAEPTPTNLNTAILNMGTAFTNGNGLAPTVPDNLLGGNLEGQTLAPGVYKWTTGVIITTGITLDGGGDPCASWVFQIAGNLTVENAAIITLTAGANAKNIFWIVAGTAADLGTTVDFSGNILCKELISMKDGAHVQGRLLSQTAVTLIGNTAVLPE